ncbi:MAG: putative protein [Holosporales bacterium]
MIINRPNLIQIVVDEFDIHPVCALLGPRQCGKTTLVKTIASQNSYHYFDCENDIHLARLENPLYTLSNLKGIIIIDEVQLRPDLFKAIRVLVDEHKDKKFLITGSASRDLIEQSSQTLAGRIGYHQVTPFTLTEVSDWKHLWMSGGFPKSYLSDRYSLSKRWRDEYIKTFLERDIASFGLSMNTNVVSKLWRMLAHYHGQVLNFAELGSSLDVDQRTIKKYIQVLEGTFMIRLLKPWFNNQKKREVKTQKIYIRDSGLLHRLLYIDNDDIDNHPKCGASFEGFVIETICSIMNDLDEVYFWGIHTVAELDLLLMINGKKIGFEIKITDSPRVTKSINHALENLEIEEVIIVTPHTGDFHITDKVRHVGIDNLPTYLSGL